jgi:hypothetical protein
MFHSLSIQVPAIGLALHNGWWRFTGAQPRLNAKVRAQAQNALALLAVSYALTTSASAYFGAMPCSVLFCQGLVVVGALVVAYEVAKYAIRYYQNGICKQGLDASRLDFARQMAYLNFINGLGCAGVNILFHEMGHALFGMACFKNALPSIVIRPFRGGSTALRLGELTPFGAFLGAKQAMLLVIVGGILASFLVAMLDFALAKAWGDTRPQCALAVRLHGISQLFNEVIYGVNSLLDPRACATSDWIYAWNLAGFSPVLILFLLVAIPLATQCFNAYLKNGLQPSA